MNKILEFLGMGKTNLIDSITNGIDKFVTTKEEKEVLRQEMEKIVSNFVLEASKIALEDVVSARNREITLKDSVGVYAQNIAAILIIGSFLGLLFIMAFYKTEIVNARLLDILIGSLGTMTVTIIGYWFGSSASSSRKDTIIQNLQK